MLTFQVETHVHDLCSLPTELIIKLLDELDFRSLLLCRQVCRFFQTIIDEDAALQYKIELAVAGMEDGPPSARSPAERLAKLKARQAAWNSLQPSSQKTIPMLRGEVWELYGGVLAQARGPQSLAFRQLPSDIRGIEEKEWMIEDVGIAIRDFGMDPAQDLLVVIETPLGRIVNTHLLELSTGRRHPIASKSVLSYRPAGSHSFAIQISGDFLGVFFISGDESESELLIWNWKTGDRELCVYSCDGAEVASFAFLSDRHVLIVGVNLPDAPLEDQQQPGLVLFVIDFLKTPADTQDIKDVDFLCTFHYPTLSPLATPLAMTVRSDPAPSWKPHHDLLVPFYTSREDRLIVVTLWVADRLVVRSLLLLIPSSILLSRVNSLAPGEFKRHFPWEEWGPQGTRLMSGPPGHSSVWVCYVFGTTFVTARRKGTSKIVQTLDFNQIDLKRRLARGEGGDENNEIITRENIIHYVDIFQDTVTTSLPFCQRTLTLPGGGDDGQFEAVMLGEDTLIMVGPQSHIRNYRILTF